MSDWNDIPDGWQMVSVNEMKSDSDYSCVGGPFGSNLTTAHYVGSPGVPVIRGTNLSGSNGRFKDDGFVYVSESKADSLRQNMAYPRDLIFTQRGTLGQVGQIPEDAKFQRYVVSQSQMKLTSNPQIADRDYLYHFFSSPHALQLIENTVEATGVPHITLGILKSLLVPLPILPEQRKIASILTTVDSLIEQTEALIEKYRRAKQGMMADLLSRGVDEHGKLRPTQKQAPHLYKQSELGWIPKEWEVETTEKLASKLWIGLVTTMTTHYVRQGVKLIRNQNIKPSGIDPATLINLSPEFADLYENRKVRHGDIVTVHTGDVGTSVIIDEHLDGAHGFATINTRVNRSLICSEYLCLVYNSLAFKRQIASVVTGDGRDNLNLKDFVKLQVPFPSQNTDQTKIASILASIDQTIEFQVTSLTKLRTLKTGLMQDLLTGKVRVKVDKDAEATQPTPSSTVGVGV